MQLAARSQIAGPIKTERPGATTSPGPIEAAAAMTGA